MNSLRTIMLTCAVVLLNSFGAAAQWVQTNGPSGGAVQCFAVRGTDLFAGTFEGGVFLSTNNGNSWTAASAHLSPPDVRALAFSGISLFAGTYGGGAFLSTNSGISWAPVNTGLTSTEVFAFSTSPNGAGGTNLFAGAFGGVFLSTTYGLSWTAVNTGLTNTDVLALAATDTNLFAGTYGGGVFLSTNNGTSWTAVNTGLTNTDVYALAVSDMNLFVGTNSGGVFLSTNNGTSWAAVNTGLTSLTVYAFATSGTSLFAGTNGGVFLSTNNGTSWTAVNTGLTSTIVYALAVSGMNLFAGTSGGGVWRLDLSDTPLPVQATGFKATASANGVVLTWQTQSEVDNLGFNIFRKNVGSGVSLKIASYISDASLRGLGTSTTGKSYSYTDKKILYGHTYQYIVQSVSTDGKTEDYPPIEVKVDVPENYALHQNYPNPFNPTTTISFQLPVRSHVALKIYDALGREVAMLVDREHSAGYHSVVFDGSGLPSGIYSYRLDAGSYHDTKKFMLVK